MSITFTSQEYLYYQLTDCDMTLSEYNRFRRSKFVKSIIPIQTIKIQLPSPSIRLSIAGIRPVTFYRRYKNRCVKYVKFTKEQRKYLSSMFKKNPKTKDYTKILATLIKMSYEGQELSEQKIYTFFKNERHRIRKRTQHK